MTDCLVCQQMQKKIGLLYEDDLVAALLSPTPAAAGHISVVPKQHHLILEQVPDWVMGRLFSLANKVSIALFEGLGVHGTNVLIANGEPAGQTVPHVAVNVVPRVENDGINLLWQPKQLGDEEMTIVESRLKEEMKSIHSFDKEAPKQKAEAPMPKNVEYRLSDEENYLIKSLRRIP